MIALILSSCERAVVGTPIQAETASPTSGQVAPTSFSGKVVGVADGDTITVLVDGREYTFGKMKGLQLTPNRLSFKGSFGPATKMPQPDKNFDVDLTVDCP